MLYFFFVVWNCGEMFYIGMNIILLLKVMKFLLYLEEQIKIKFYKLCKMIVVFSKVDGMCGDFFGVVKVQSVIIVIFFRQDSRIDDCCDKNCIC